MPAATAAHEPVLSPHSGSAGVTETDRRALAATVMRLFEHWRLAPADQLELLGLANDNRAALSRYRSGAPLANSRDLLERAGHLLAIHKNLRLLFPENRDLAYAWMTTPNRAFGSMTPVQAVRTHGFTGLVMARTYLDRQRGG